jgi:nucleoside 2-deoxyribosyltransferase
VKETGFNLEKLNDRPEAGIIDNILRQRIRQVRFVICDLTHGNHGAYWEAGFAEGLGKPVIYTCKKAVFEGAEGEKPHFDTNHHQTIVWSVDNLEKNAEELKATIRCSIPEAKN